MAVNLDGYLEEAVHIAYAMGRRDAMLAVEQSLGDLLDGQPPVRDLGDILRETHGLLALEEVSDECVADHPNLPERATGSGGDGGHAGEHPANGARG